MNDEQEYDGFITYQYAPSPPQRTSIHGIVEMDDTGFWFRGEKIEDAGEAHRAFLEAVYRGEATELRRALETITAECNRLRLRLRMIANTPPDLEGDLPSSVMWWLRLVVDMRDQARAALQGEGDE